MALLDNLNELESFIKKCRSFSNKILKLQKFVDSKRSFFLLVVFKGAISWLLLPWKDYFQTRSRI